jgi:alpha,alpha-trehalose phosphorylase
MASLAGTWIAIVAGLGGMRDHDGILSFAPCLPQALARITFRLCFAGRKLRVDVKPTQVTYSLLDGEPLEIIHRARRATVSAERPLTRSIPPLHPRDAPTQPAGRAPEHRRLA